MVQKSKANENEFVEIFKNIDNIESIPLSTDKKKSKKGARKSEAAIAPAGDKNDLHWTEEERGQWNPSAKTNHSQVSDMLNAMKAMAVQGDTNVINSLKSTIYHCQKVDEENKLDIERIKMERKNQEEERKKQKEEQHEKQKLENKTIQEKEKQNGFKTKIPVEPVTNPVKKISREEQQRLEEEEEDRKILELEKKLEKKKRDEEILEEKIKSDFERQIIKDTKKMDDKRKVEADKVKKREEINKLKEQEEERNKKQILKKRKD